MGEPILFLGLTILMNLFCFSIGFAFDGPVQDFCVADLKSTVRVNGFPCKSPETVDANDFFFSGLHLPSNTSNIFGAGFTPVSVNQVPGLNNLGIAMARVDLLRGGLFPPHIHPKATEVVVVLDGTLQVGFVTSNPTYTHFTKTLNKGDGFAVPPGLVHYAYNVANITTSAIVSFSNENFGVSLLNRGIFGTKPEISSDFLAKSFFLDQKIVKEVQAKFK